MPVLSALDGSLLLQKTAPLRAMVRTIQGHVTERYPGVPTRALGQHNIPGICQNVKLEDATILKAQHIVDAAAEVMTVEQRGQSSWAWIPPRFYVVIKVCAVELLARCTRTFTAWNGEWLRGVPIGIEGGKCRLIICGLNAANSDRIRGLNLYMHRMGRRPVQSS